MSQDSGRSPNYAVPALEKGLDILEYLSGQRRPQTQAQIARHLGRGPSELFRMLTVLERRGYLRRDPVSGAYDLTLRLYELGQTHSPYDYLIRVARRSMRELAIALGQSCHLGVIQHGRLIVLHQEEGMTRVRLSVEVGSSIPVLESASGRLLLASLPPDERAELLLEPGTARPHPARTGTGEQRLDDRLDVIRAQGYEAVRGEQTEGVSDLAVLIGAPRSQTRAALAVAALARDHDAFIASSLPLVRQCATRIGHAAGILPDADPSPDHHPEP